MGCLLRSHVSSYIGKCSQQGFFLIVVALATPTKTNITTTRLTRFYRSFFSTEIVGRSEVLRTILAGCQYVRQRRRTISISYLCGNSTNHVRLTGEGRSMAQSRRGSSIVPLMPMKGRKMSMVCKRRPAAPNVVLFPCCCQSPPFHPTHF